MITLISSMILKAGILVWCLWTAKLVLQQKHLRPLNELILAIVLGYTAYMQLVAILEVLVL